MENEKGREKMKRKRYSAKQIVQALRQAEAESPGVEIYRKLGVSEQTFYRWKRRDSGVGSRNSGRRNESSSSWRLVEFDMAIGG